METFNYSWHLALNGWAGFSRVPVKVIKECPKRVKVIWLKTAYQHGEGTISYVPKTTLCRYDGNHWQAWPG